WRRARGLLTPVFSLLPTSRKTKAGSSVEFCRRKRCTADGFHLHSSRNDHESALLTIGSRSLARNRQIANVRPSARRSTGLRLSSTVATRAARRHQRSLERVQSSI